MRNLIAIIFLLFAGSSFCQWVERNTQVTTADLFTISAPYDNIAWASDCDPSGVVIIRSTNSGVTWTNVTTSTFNTRSAAVVCGINEDIAVVGTRDKVHRTTNGGTSWYEVLAPGGFINAISIDTNGNGILQGDPVGGRFSIWKTTDFGETWVRLPGSPTAMIDHYSSFNSLFHKDSLVYFCTNQYRVYGSTDGGYTWDVDTSVGWWPIPVWFNNPQTGMYAGPMTKTTNGGATWSTITVPGSGSAILGITGYENNWWYTRRNSTVHRSTDNGVTWNTDSLPNGVQLFFITKSLRGTALYISASDGLVYTNSGSIGIETVSHAIPEKFSLYQNYPNPFNPSTKIRFDILKSSFVELTVFDASGRLIKKLLNKNLQAGTYESVFDGAGIPSGVYFYTLKTSEFTETKKMILLK